MVERSMLDGDLSNSEHVEEAGPIANIVMALCSKLSSSFDGNLLMFFLVVLLYLLTDGLLHHLKNLLLLFAGDIIW